MNSETTTIRKAVPADREIIKDLWYKAIKDAFDKDALGEVHDPKDELAFKMDQLDDAFESPDSHYYLLFDESALVGTIAYGTPPNKGIQKRTDGELSDMVEIGSLYIDPAAQKKGYGRTLLIFILQTLLDQGVETVCFDSIIEWSKRIWIRLFGEPKYRITSKKHDFEHMIWVVDVQTSIERLRQ